MPQSPYTYSDIQGGFRSYYDQSPGSVFTNWLNQYAFGEGDKQRLQSMYNDYYAAYRLAAAANPQNTNYFADYLYQFDPRAVVASTSPESRGTDLRQYDHPVRWIAF